MEKADYELELLALADMQASGSWHLFEARLRKMERQWIDDLIGSNDDETRGKIKALRQILGIPAILAGEMKSATQKCRS